METDKDQEQKQEHEQELEQEQEYKEVHPPGSQQRGVHHHDPQLPPQTGEHPLHAQVDQHYIPSGRLYS